MADPFRHRRRADRPAAWRSLVLTAATLVTVGSVARAATLEIAVSGVRTGKGFLRAAVCSRTTFLTDNCEYFADQPATPGQTVLTVSDVVPGTYAIQVFDDDLGLGVIHQGLLGIPREGIGFSNDAKLHLRGPRFDEAAVAIPRGKTRIVMRLRYLRPGRPTVAAIPR